MWHTDDLTSAGVERRVSAEDDAYLVDSLMPGSIRRTAMNVEDVRAAAHGEMMSFSRAKATAVAKLENASGEAKESSSKAKATADTSAAADTVAESDNVTNVPPSTSASKAAGGGACGADESALVADVVQGGDDFKANAEKQRRHLELENERVTWE